MNTKLSFLKREKWLLLIVLIVSIIVIWLGKDYTGFLTKGKFDPCPFLVIITLSFATLLFVSCLVLLVYPCLKTLRGKIAGFLIVFLFAICVNFYYLNVVSDNRIETKYEIQGAHIQRDTVFFKEIKEPLVKVSAVATDTISEKTTFINILLCSVNNSLSVFFPSRGNYRMAEKLNGNEQLFLNFYYLSHLLAYVYFALLAISVINAGRRMMNRSRTLFNYKKRYVFAGANEASILLAEDLMKTDKNDTSVIFYLPYSVSNNHELFEKLDSLGFIVKYVPLDGSRMYKISRRHINKGNAYFFLDNNEDLNIKLALKFIDRWKNINVKKDLNIYISVETEDIGLLFNNVIENVDKSSKLHLHIFNQSDITARQFVIEHPMLTAPLAAAQEENNILILGFGYLGKEILTKTICDAQYTQKRLTITVIDEHIENYYSDFRFRCTEAIEKYKIDFNPEGVHHARSRAFFNWLLRDNAAKLLSFNRIFVTLGNSRINVDLAQNICNLRKNYGLKNSKKVIFAHINETGAYNYFNETSNESITTFGNPDKIYTKSVVVNEEMDTIAKQLHFKWSASHYPTAEKAWFGDRANLLWNQDSSRASAMGIGNILHLLGMKTIKASDKREDDVIVEDEEFANRLMENNYIDILAEKEHKRWNAYHFTKGIRLWKMEDVNYETLKESGMKANQIKEHNRHAALIDFDQLPKLDQLINAARERWNSENSDNTPKKPDNNQQKDRDSILEIPRSLRQALCLIIYKNS